MASWLQHTQRRKCVLGQRFWMEKKEVAMARKLVTTFEILVFTVLFIAMLWVFMM